MVATLTQPTGVVNPLAALRESSLRQIHPSVVVTVFDGTLSVHQTMAALFADDRAFSCDIPRGNFASRQGRISCDLPRP